MNKKKLQKIYSKAKGNKDYYSFESFCNDAKSFLKDIRNRNVVMSMKVSRSGMTRRFNSVSYNGLLNICYNGKVKFDEVVVGGCGMDMHWDLLFTTCEQITGKDQVQTDYNRLCSHQPLL